jgi:hypothetical protein
LKFNEKISEDIKKQISLSINNNIINTVDAECKTEGAEISFFCPVGLFAPNYPDDYITDIDYQLCIILPDISDLTSYDLWYLKLLPIIKLNIKIKPWINNIKINDELLTDTNKIFNIILAKENIFDFSCDLNVSGTLCVDVKNDWLEFDVNIINTNQISFFCK